MSWVEGHYNVQPHGGIDGRTPLSVFEEEADGNRFVSDFVWLTAQFVVHVERKVRKDATCTLAGRTLEVPQHFRGATVQLHYAVQRPETVWIMDGGTHVYLREVDDVANSRRARVRELRKPETTPPPATGINGVEAMLRRSLRPSSIDENGEEGGAVCVPF